MKSIRLRYLGLLFAVYMVMHSLTRLTLFVCMEWDTFDSLSSLMRVFGSGLFHDLLPFFCMTLPLAALVLLPGTRILGNKTCRACAVFFGIYTGLFLFTAVAEVLFWDEFRSRFNFIAVDYLVYTTEVIKNIVESYHVLPLFAGIGIGTVLVTGCVLRPLRCQSRLSPPARAAFAVWAGMALLTLVYTPPADSDNVVERELSANGVWSLCAAFRHNQLDYRQFYPTMDTAEALRTLRTELTEPDAFFLEETDGWRRRILHAGDEQRLNVIQIVVESLGTASLGERTPNLNALADQSLRFTQLMATGTRTVRGIEALTLSIPPTPGASIVRRPGNEGLFTIGSVFRERGYDTSFIYGGFGYFDNMNAYFAGNGFRIVDRAVLPDANKTFANVWGVCDEDLLDAALREADASFAAKTPFYQFVLTTSNHRPFTYPDGKIDIPSGTSRSGAIKYTDYAIGRFLREAAQRPWFKDTVFVIVGDHTAGSAGKTDLPPEKYAIPCLIYSPAHLAPATVDTLCSQIDVPPTLFAVLRWNYDTGFFGKNILTMPSEQGRAWIGTYQLLGRLTTDTLVVLEPLKPLQMLKISSEETAQHTDKELIATTLAGYQTAQDLFTSGALRMSAAGIE